MAVFPGYDPTTARDDLTIGTEVTKARADKPFRSGDGSVYENTSGRTVVAIRPDPEGGREKLTRPNTP